jgi:uncharacterized HAD superfamily protein
MMAERPMETDWILLVDDSLTTGSSMRDAVQRIREAGFAGKITTCAVVVEPSQYQQVDLHFFEMPQPRVFEWNAFHHSVVEDACFDLDGILCVDPTTEENDDGPRYREFLRCAQPRFRPTGVIGNIVSARLERYRELTEQWLAANHIAYRQLHLVDLPCAEERTGQRTHCAYKAKVYRESGAAIFFENEPAHAEEIAHLSGRPVLCTGDMHLYLPGLRTWPLREIAKWKLAVPHGRIMAKLRSWRREVEKITSGRVQPELGSGSDERP